VFQIIGDSRHRHLFARLRVFAQSRKDEDFAKALRVEIEEHDVVGVAEQSPVPAAGEECGEIAVTKEREHLTRRADGLAPDIDPQF
jgi:hypothetical protein